MTDRALAAREDPACGLAVHDLSVGTVHADAPTVLAVHGITANGLAWRVVADELGRRRPGTRFLAPDLAGRAESGRLAGPWGLERHARDLLAIADDTRPVVVGHSMGAFVTALMAARAPDKVGAAVLVDGGLAFPAPPGADIDALIEAVIGPAMARLRMRFAGPAAYLDFWRAHPAVGPLLAGDLSGRTEAYLLHDLTPADDGSGEWVSTCVLDAIRQDGGDVLSDASAHGAVREAVEAGVLTSFVWAGRGLMDEAQGLYDETRLAALDLPEALEVRSVPDTNHYGIIMADGSAAVVVDLIEAALDGAS